MRRGRLWWRRWAEEGDGVDDGVDGRGGGMRTLSTSGDGLRTASTSGGGARMAATAERFLRLARRLARGNAARTLACGKRRLDPSPWPTPPLARALLARWEPPPPPMDIGRGSGELGRRLHRSRQGRDGLRRGEPGRHSSPSSGCDLGGRRRRALGRRVAGGGMNGWD
jgi:hypothetical protein